MSVRRPRGVRRTARRPLGVLAGALVLLLAGCAEDEPEPKFAEPSESPTASASPAVVEETPEEFIRRWAETERDMLNTGETEAYEAITGPCESCGKLVQQIKEYYTAGGYVRWEGYKVRRIQPIKDDYYEVRVSGSPTEYKTASTSQVQRLPGGKSVYRLQVVEKDGTRVLADFVELGR